MADVPARAVPATAVPARAVPATTTDAGIPVGSDVHSLTLGDRPSGPSFARYGVPDEASPAGRGGGRGSMRRFATEVAQSPDETTRRAS
jgi:hypothetical protein